MSKRTLDRNDKPAISLDSIKITLKDVLALKLENARIFWFAPTTARKNKKALKALQPMMGHIEDLASEGNKTFPPAVKQRLKLALECVEKAATYESRGGSAYVASVVVSVGMAGVFSYGLLILGLSLSFMLPIVLVGVLAVVAIAGIGIKLFQISNEYVVKEDAILNELDGLLKSSEDDNEEPLVDNRKKSNPDAKAKADHQQLISCNTAGLLNELVKAVVPEPTSPVQNAGIVEGTKPAPTSVKNSSGVQTGQKYFGGIPILEPGQLLTLKPGQPYYVRNPANRQLLVPQWVEDDNEADLVHEPENTGNNNSSRLN